MEFGNGRYRKRMFGASTSQTSSIGAWTSRDKHLTNHYLRAAGLPVPESIVARSLYQALAAARTIGYPVAIKPLDLGEAAVAVEDPAYAWTWAGRGPQARDGEDGGPAVFSNS